MPIDVGALNYLNRTFTAPDPQEILQQRYQNALLRNAVQEAPIRNQYLQSQVDQEQLLNQAARAKLAAGNRGEAAQIYAGIATSDDPLAAAQNAMSNPQLAKIVQDAGVPFHPQGLTPQDTKESVGKEAYTTARMLGVDPFAKEQYTLKPGEQRMEGSRVLATNSAPAAGENSKYVLAGFTASGRPVQVDRAGKGGIYGDTGEPWNRADKIVKYAIETGPAGDKFAVNTVGTPGAPGQPGTVPLVTREQALADVQARENAQKTGAGQAERTLDFPQAQARLSASNAKMDRLANSVNEILNDQNLWKAVGLGRGMAMIPGSAAADVRAKIDALQSQVGLAVLQDLRDNSKSGGAVGQVSNFEQQLFQNNLAAIGNLNQSPEAFRQQLQKILEFTRSSKERLGAAFQMTYPPAGSSPAGSAMPDFSKMSDDDLRRLANGQQP